MSFQTFYWFTAIFFILIPLILLAIFNTFLILAVKRSSKQRSKLTSSISVKRPPPSTFSPSGDEGPLSSSSTNKSFKFKREFTSRKGFVQRDVNQENKITRMLIAVVLLAIMCQLPTAMMLIYTSFFKVTFLTFWKQSHILIFSWLSSLENVFFPLS